MSLVSCVPNFSEGRRLDVIDEIRAAIAAVPGVVVLDVSSDEAHNRSVITFVAPVAHAVDAAFAGIRVARDRIDLTVHHGEHPRMGATDVVPFVPLEGTTMDECIALARELGARVGDTLEIPVYLYERAATRPGRENLADVRRGEFEGLRDAIVTDPARARRTSGRRTCTPRRVRSRSARGRFSWRTTCTSVTLTTCRSRKVWRKPCAAPPVDCAT